MTILNSTDSDRPTEVEGHNGHKKGKDKPLGTIDLGGGSGVKMG